MPAREPKVSVVIPVKNAGKDVSALLRSLRSQKGVGTLQIIAVDSGSTDATLSIARRYGCEILKIAPRAFSHSFARNEGARLARGEFILFTVQDALPVGKDWLRKMLRPLRGGTIASTCRAVPRPDADIFSRYLAMTHYRYVGWTPHDRIVGPVRGGREDWIRSSALDDVACVFRREVFSGRAFRGGYGEDVELAVRLLREGKRLALLSSVKVVHSHDRPPFYFFKRFFIAWRFLREQGLETQAYETPPIAAALARVRGLFGAADHLAAGIRRVPRGASPAELWRALDAEFSLTRIQIEVGASLEAQRLDADDLSLTVFLKRFGGGKPVRPRDNPLVAELWRQWHDARLFLRELRPRLDGAAAPEIADTVVKIAAIIGGKQLADACARGGGTAARRVAAVLSEGV